MTQEAFFFTCYGVFDVIGWFPCENTRNVSLLANEANRAVLEPFRSRSGEFGALSLKMTREEFFFTCNGVFDVIGWFPCENTRKREFTCKRIKRGCFGAVRMNAVLFRSE